MNPRPLALLAAGALSAGLLAVAPTAAHADSDECVAGTVANNNNPANQAPAPVADTAKVLAGGDVVVPVLANDTDPDGDTLAVVNVTAPNRGEACVLPDGSVLFSAEAARRGYTARFQYGVSDGDRYRRASVQVQVAPLKAVKPALRSKLQLTKAGKVKKRARLVFTNRNSATVTISGARIVKNTEDETVAREEFERTLRPGKRVVIPTGARRLMYQISVESGSRTTFVNYGVINTRTGRQAGEYIGYSYDSDEDWRVAQRALRAGIA